MVDGDNPLQLKCTRSAYFTSQPNVHVALSHCTAVLIVLMDDSVNPLQMQHSCNNSGPLRVHIHNLHTEDWLLSSAALRLLSIVDTILFTNTSSFIVCSSRKPHNNRTPWQDSQSYSRDWVCNASTI